VLFHEGLGSFDAFHRSSKNPFKFTICPFPSRVRSTVNSIPFLGTLLCLQPLLFAEAKTKVDFAREVRPILSNYCFHCHGPDDKNRKGGEGKGLRLDQEDGARADLGGRFAVVPSHPEKSEILERILSKDSDEVMPPPKTGKKPTVKEIEILRRWISEGAPWAPHWAYSKPVRPVLPEVPKSTWSSHPVDRFLIARLGAEGLKPNAQAQRSTLIRRVSLDLTGLPPVPSEVDAFEKDPAPDAYERMVDRMLAKSSFGEHWARLWLDLARYADSAGYPSDPGRSIWAYRDYVIRAFNENKPFDQFTIEQLAGDLLPNATQEQIIATAFHRNTMTNNEGGTSDEEFRNAAIVDRVSTTWSVWQGTSMACAQCHTHKFDPISHHDYFSFFAILNQTEDADRRDDSPFLEFYLPEEKEKKEGLEKSIQELESVFKNPPEAWLKNFAKWDQEYPRDLQWARLSPSRVVARSGADPTVRPDGSLYFSKPAEKGGEDYVIDAAVAGGSISAIRLLTVSDDALPGKGAGFGANGSFSIESIRAVLVPNGLLGRNARYVRVELTGKSRPLQVEEIEVISGGKNVALGAQVESSPVHGAAEAARAVDGKTGESHALVTRGEAAGEFVEVDLGVIQRVEKINLSIPSSGGYYLGSFKVTLLDAQKKVVETRVESDLREPSFAFEPLDGRELKYKAVYASSVMAGHEPQSVVGLKVLDPEKNKTKGWAVANTAKPQWLVLLPERPIDAKQGDIVRVEIGHKGRRKDQQLGSFALDVTADQRVQTYASAPVAIAEALQKNAADRSAPQVAQVTDYYVREQAQEASSERSKLVAARKQLAELKPNSVLIMRELAADKKRTTNIQIRGNYQNLGDEVRPRTPEIFPALPAGQPADRLAMARWLVSPENPLTARVTANRFWEAIFGVGIVRTSEEFGAQGEMPVHPDLLDWLATELQRSGWNVKAFMKLLVTSEAYKQDSSVTPELFERDPDNRLLARGPRFRVTGEVLRDQALFVSGLLSPKMYGKPVRPPKPSSGLNTAFGRANDWETSSGEDRYRRAIYTEVRRNSPYPSFTTFDAPNREVCTVRRGRTNTPLQAFVTLNDPVFVEAAQALARKICSEGGTTDASRLEFAFRTLLGRHPSTAEASRLGKLLDGLRAGFSEDRERAIKMATDPAGPLTAGADPVELASWSSVSNVLLNLDEVLMRR
jgi:hypothetical protein